MEETAHMRLMVNISYLTSCVTRPISIEELNAKLMLAQCDLHKAMEKFNATNPSEKKKVNPPRYLTWARTCLNYAKRMLDNIDSTHNGNRLALKRLQWLQRNLKFVDNAISREMYPEDEDVPFPGELGFRPVGVIKH